MARIAGKVSEVKYARADRRHTDRDGAHLRNARRAYSRAERREGRKACVVIDWGPLVDYDELIFAFLLS